MNDEQVLKIFKPVDKLWDKIQSTEAKSPWHGYGWRKDGTSLVVRPFVEKREDLSRIEEAIKAELPKEITVKGLVIPRFGARSQREQDDRLKPGNLLAELSPLEPGKVVFASGCRNACPGTIGAFLKGGNPPGIWLLSNCHVLFQCGSQNGVKGENEFFIGDDVRPVTLKPSGNSVDAAVVRVRDTSRLNLEFKGIDQKLDSKAAPFPNLGEEEIPVQKLGQSTGPRSGKLILRGQRVNVSDCSHVEREFEDQLVIISAQEGRPFADGGDSGSMVVAGTQPIGLLFGMTLSELPITQNEQPDVTASPEMQDEQRLTESFIACRWDLVIKEVETVAGGPLELMLDNKMAAVG